MIIIPLTQGKVTVIDDIDAYKVSKFKWHAIKRRDKWYAAAYKRGSGRKNFSILLLHRFLTNCPKKKEVDHKDHDGLNNSQENLRICSRSQNAANLRVRKNNTSGFRGVAFMGDGKRRRRWKAEITVNNVAIWLGSFYTAAEAAKKYNEASLKYHGEFGIRNFIQTD